MLEKLKKTALYAAIESLPKVIHHIHHEASLDSHFALSKTYDDVVYWNEEKGIKVFHFFLFFFLKLRLISR